MTEPTLHTPVGEVPGITPRQAGLLRALGLTNLGRLVAHIPFRHETLEAETTIDQLVPGQIVSARGEITATRPVRRPGKSRFEAVLCDHTGRLDLVWFNALYMADRVHPGLRVRVQGKANTRGPGLQIVNPSLEVLSAEAGAEPPRREPRVRPIYPANEDLSSGELARIITKVLPLALPLIEDHLPEVYRAARELPALREAYRMLHAPASLAEAAGARRRLAYDEWLMLQLGVHIKRAHLRGRLRAPALRWNPALDAHIRAQLPHTLTPAQDQAVREIAKDLATPTPCNRLLQGDVGSGKTLVALYAMLLAVAAGHQASLMAPTEILAEQHAASIRAALASTRVRVELLTGTTPPADRAAILARLAQGDIDILVGTHALLTDAVRFKSPALAVIDEQHRFGVAQRARLRGLASDDTATPHVLVMTATPIPRTLAITLFGDLDITTLTGLPPGRRPVETRVLPYAQRADAYAEVARRLAGGQQAFIVVPAIGDDPADTPLLPPSTPATPGPRRDVHSTLADLEAGSLQGFRLAALHAQLPRAEREQVMDRFRRRELDAIVATTVIEVGVDVPNATAIVIEQADRFGLAQLHQLRGRVGRGDKPSTCLLIADPTTPEATQRLDIMARTTDGFVLAERDLELRGPGELFGTRQSGLPPFKAADLRTDRDLLAMARRDAAAWIDRSPTLAAPDEALLRRRLRLAVGQSLDLGDVG